tara:strand:+ start:492 stop:716 length:225 start_codon:yes stop_codon:yes gene_type:complete
MKISELTIIGTVATKVFYEHPLLGDEAPLQRLVPEPSGFHFEDLPDVGFKLEETPWWDLPDREEVIDYYEERER